MFYTLLFALIKEHKLIKIGVGLGESVWRRLPFNTYTVLLFLAFALFCNGEYCLVQLMLLISSMKCVYKTDNGKQLITAGKYFDFTSL